MKNENKIPRKSVAEKRQKMYSPDKWNCTVQSRLDYLNENKARLEKALMLRLAEADEIKSKISYIEAQIAEVRFGRKDKKNGNKKAQGKNS